MGIDSPFSLLRILLRSISIEPILGYSLCLSYGLYYSNFKPKVSTSNPQAISNYDVRFPQPFCHGLHNTWTYYSWLGDPELEDEPNIHANYGNTQYPSSYSLCSKDSGKIALITIRHLRIQLPDIPFHSCLYQFNIHVWVIERFWLYLLAGLSMLEDRRAQLQLTQLSHFPSLQYLIYKGFKNQASVIF